tara:strand:+ start:118 stop:528 length:411 start_codon:yes stop_codon:yes gene_type:complete
MDLYLEKEVTVIRNLNEILKENIRAILSEYAENQGRSKKSVSEYVRSAMVVIQGVDINRIDIRLKDLENLQNLEPCFQKECGCADGYGNDVLRNIFLEWMNTGNGDNAAKNKSQGSVYSAAINALRKALLTREKVS